MTQNGPPKKDSEFLPNSAIETQKTQKLGVFAEILPPLESLRLGPIFTTNNMIENMGLIKEPGLGQSLPPP